MTGGGAVMNPHGFGLASTVLILRFSSRSAFKKVLRCVGTAVLDRRLCLTIKADNYIAVAVRLIVLLSLVLLFMGSRSGPSIFVVRASKSV